MPSRQLPATSTVPNPAIDAYLERRIAVVITLIVQRYDIPPRDAEDWEQDLRIAILASIPGFDAGRSSWHTYANSVIQRAAKCKIREMTAICRDRQSSESLDEFLATEDEPSGIVDRRQENAARAKDTAEAVQLALSRMTDDERAVAQALMTMSPEAAIAHLGWSRWRFYNVKDRVARALVRAGIQ